MGKIKVWISFSPWILCPLHWFFYQSANDNWTKICFSKHCLNNILFNVLLKYSSQYSKSIIFPVEHSVRISATFHLNVVVVVVIILKKIILTFLFIWLYHCHGRRKYKRHSFVYRFQALHPNSIKHLRFINFYRKAKKKRLSWHSETWLDIDCLLESQ